MEWILTAAALIVLGVVAMARRGRRAPQLDLVQRIGVGDLSDVHAAVRDGERVVVKIPRGSGLDDLLVHEFAVLADLRARAGESSYSKYLPEPVELGVLRWKDGFRTAEEIRARYPGGLDGRHVAWMFKRTLEILGFAHRAGWVHGAVLPPHLLFHPEDHGLLLVGWTHATRVPEPIRFVPDAYGAWYPPEIRGRRPATPSVDLYLAARSMIHLAGGDAVRGEPPKSLPPEIRRFLEACLLESPGARGQDAWQLHEEFTRVLEGVYGPPKFVPLVMT
jgi:hypothetical protein